jgi:hypothetical protein
MTQERIQKLEEIGFEFVTNPKKGGKAKLEISRTNEETAYMDTDDAMAQQGEDAAAAAVSVVEEIEDSHCHAAVQI